MVCLQLPKQCVWELEMKDQSGGGWRTIHPASGTLSVTASPLAPGTKYIFRARAGVRSSSLLLGSAWRTAQAADDLPSLLLLL